MKPIPQIMKSTVKPTDFSRSDDMIILHLYTYFALLRHLQWEAGNYIWKFFL